MMTTSRTRVVAVCLALATWSCQAAPTATDDDPAPPAASTDGTIVPEPASVPRLTNAQHRRALEALFGAPLPTIGLEADSHPHLLARIGASTSTLSERGVEQLEQTSVAVAEAVFADTARAEALVGCSPSAVDDPCIATFLASFGRQAFRRPLSDEELELWSTLVEATAGGDPWRGLTSTVASMLQSPAFAYRLEVGHADDDSPSGWAFSDHEIASRLAFLLWDAPPDDALLDAAEAGELRTREGRLQHARRLLADDRARDAVLGLFDQILDLDALDDIQRDPETYPTFSPTLAAAMRAEVRFLVEDVVFDRRDDVRTLFSTQRTFVNSTLAEHYGIEAPDADPISFTAARHPEGSGRAGVLTSAAVLTLTSHEDQTSPTRRGAFLQNRILCGDVPPPPANVNTELAPPSETGDATLREILAEHRTNPSCSSCHDMMDPPGFLFEGFDVLGRARDVDDRGHPVDASGDLDGHPMNGAADLGAWLATDDRVSACMVRHAWRFAQSRLETDAEAPVLEELVERFDAGDHRLDALLLAIVAHPSTWTPAPPAEVP